MIDSTPFPIHVSAFQIRYVDVPRHAVPVRSAAPAGRTASLVRAAIAVIVVAMVALAIYGFVTA